MTKQEKFSYSKIEQYNQCPFAYYLKYVCGNYFYEPNVAAFYGSLVHKILEQITSYLSQGEKIPYAQLKADFMYLNLPKRNRYDRDGDIFGIDKLQKMFSKEWDTFSNKSGLNYRLKADNFLNYGIYDFEKYMLEHPELEIVGAEIPFSFNFRDYIFSGYIDRLLKVKGTKKYLIFDIKTKDTPFSDKDLTTPLQFVVYSKALYERYGDDIEIECYYDLPTLRLIQPAGTNGFFKRGMKKINSILDSIEAKMWEPSPSALCWWCSFRRKNGMEESHMLCPYYSLWTPDNKTYDKKFEWSGIENYVDVMKKFMRNVEFEREIDESGIKINKMLDSIF